MAETKPSKLPHKKEKKTKERDTSVKAITAALKALPHDQQVSTVLSKYAEMAEENRRLQTNMKTAERQVQLLQRDKDQMESEHSKIVLAKSKLESLCRELQKQNKIIKEENLARLREEEERRKEVSTKFNVTLSEISNLMKENSDKNSKLRDENQDMATRLQDLIKQYEAREVHVEKMVKQKELQCQLSEAKLAKQQIEMTEDRERLLLEKKTLLEEIASYQKKTQQMSLNEISLRTQLNSYMEKYEDFQNTLEKSNQIFHTFKKEMEEMSKKVKKTEKDTKTWKEHAEGANKALLEMVSERSLLEKQLDLQVRQNKQLQNLCRALQQQLTEVRNRDKNKTEFGEKASEASDQQHFPLVEENSSVEETSTLEDENSLKETEEVATVSENCIKEDTSGEALSEDAAVNEVAVDIVEQNDFEKVDELVKEVVENVNESVMEEVEKLAESLKEEVEKVGESVKTDVEKFAESLKEEVEKDDESVKDEVEKVGESVKTDVEKFAESLKEKVEKVDESVKDEVEKVCESVKTDVETFAESLKQDVEKFDESGKKEAEKVENAKELGEEQVEYCNELINEEAKGSHYETSLSNMDEVD